MSAKHFLAPFAPVFFGLLLLMPGTFALAQSESNDAVPAGSSNPSSVTTTTIPATMFGMSAHNEVLYGTPWPTMPITGLRLWDASVAWQQINTANGVYDWTTLDLWTAAAASHNQTLIYTFGQTPSWASSNPTDDTCDYAPGACYPPNDLNSDGTGTDQHWIDFVSAIAKHAPEITYWEMWNTPHDVLQWNGTNAQLVRMVQDARTYIQKYIPTAKIISPANGQLNYTYPSGNCTMADKMGGYLAAGLGKYIDIIALHTYYTTVPENIIAVVQCYQSTMATYGVSSLPLWSTEGAWGTDAELPGTTDQEGFLARLYLLLWSNGVPRHYWYAWDDPITGTLSTNGVPNAVAAAYQEVESWMSGRTMTTLCSEASSGIWTCGLTGPNGYQAQAVWHAGSTKNYTAPSQYVNYLDLTGKQHTISKGATVTVGVEPILLQNQSSTATANFVFSEATPFPDVLAGSKGTSGSITVSATNGFTGTVTLSCPNSFGTGSCSITPTSVKSYPATATLVINGTSFTAGTYDMTVQGTSGSITNTFSVPFTVSDFSITGPASVSAAPSGNAVATLTVTSLDSYNSKVNATCNATALSGAVCTLSPANPITVGSGAAVSVTATVTVPSTAKAGTYNVTVTATDTSGEPTHTVTVPLVVTASDFSLTGPASLSALPAGKAVANFTVASLDSYNSKVNATCSVTAISGATCALSPANPITVGSGASVPFTATITVPSTAVAGSYNISVTAADVSGTPTHTLTIPFTVSDFSLTGPASLTGAPSANVTANLTVTSLDSYSSQINATCDATALSGAVCTLSPANPITIGSAAAVPVTATVTLPSAAAAGTYNIKVTATDVSGAPTHTLTMPLTVTASPVIDFSIGAPTPTTQTINAGQSTTYTFSVAPVGSSFPSAVALTCSGAPAISQCTFNPTSVTPGSSSASVVMTITTTASTAKAVRSAAQPRGGVLIFFTSWLALPGFVLLGGAPRKPRHRKSTFWISLVALLLLAMLLTSCSGATGISNNGGGGGGGGGQQGTAPGTYSIIVTGTSGALTHQAPAVQLVVN